MLRRLAKEYACRLRICARSLRRVQKLGWSDSAVCDAVAFPTAERARARDDSGWLLPRIGAGQARCLDQDTGDLGRCPRRWWFTWMIFPRSDCSIASRRAGNALWCGGLSTIWLLGQAIARRSAKAENDGGELLQRDGIPGERDHASLSCRVQCSSAEPLVQHYSKANYYRIDGDRDPSLIASELFSGLPDRHKNKRPRSRSQGRFR